MIMNIKQRKIKIEPKTKLNYNIYKNLVDDVTKNDSRRVAYGQ